MGRLHLIMGCMFAQKTTELLRRVRRYQSIGHKVLVVNFIGDTRYGTECVASHDKVFEKALCVRTLRELQPMITDYDVIAIDEGQFFTDLFDCITEWADTLPIHIVVAGLSGNFKREPFGDILRLIPHAEEVEHLNAFCAVCRDGTIATFSKYIECTDTLECTDLQEHNDKQNKETIKIGGAESYKPVCRKHFLM